MTITGTVKDADGAPIPGASVSIKGMPTRGTGTDKDGQFKLETSEPNPVLVIRSIGYVTQEVAVGSQSQLNIVMQFDEAKLDEVIVVGYGQQKKGSITGAISNVTSDDIEMVKAPTVSGMLAGKIPGLSFRMPDGRPGAGANISIRNMGNPLYVIDGIQQDAGQFNNLSPNDIESITVLKDASAAIYGVRAANGVILVTTKRGKAGSTNTINLDTYYGWQNWTRFPKGVNAYEWMLGRADAEMNAVNPQTGITLEEIERWRLGEEPGYQSFDWYDFVVSGNAPQSSVNLNATGGSDKINYYLSLTRLDQDAVFGNGEFTFNRTNLQSNVDAQIAERLKVGVQINGRIETRDQPGVPEVDDYWLPRFAIFRNRPTERPYANDNPLYPNHLSNIQTNWAIMNKDISGYWREDWRVLQTNFNVNYDIPIKGLSATALYSYYLADRVMNGHEYTYQVYTYRPSTDTYDATGGSSNPWRERGTRKVFNNVAQVHLNYNNTFGDRHTVGATLVAERISRRILDTWVHTVPTNNVLPILQFADMDTYNDLDDQEARLGYVGRFNYNFGDKYYLELAGRYDASWKFAPNKRWGFFPSVSGGWRITEEAFLANRNKRLLNDLKIRASYGSMGDDDVGIGPFDYIPGYRYGSSTVIIDGQVVRGIRDRGVPIDNISWFTTTTLDVGTDFSFLEGKLSGSLDYFRRKRTGLRGPKWDILVPAELGYNLPDENVNSDSQIGFDGSLLYTNSIGEFTYRIGGNAMFGRTKFLESYMPRWGNSWEHYRTSGEGRWSNIFWGYQVIGQFQSQEEINNYPINIDGEGNRTLLPGDFIYMDVNGDGKIDGYDERPIGYPAGQLPLLTFGLNLGASYKGFDITADFSGGGMYSYVQNWEMRWPFQNTGNLLQYMYEDRWHREDPYDLNSPWIAGENPPLRFNQGGHSNYNKNSDWWLTNVRYLRLRTLEIGYSLPKSFINKLGAQRARFFVNTYNLFSMDNVSGFGVDPEIYDGNGLQYPQNKFINIGANISF
ncbi:SusC/RagA family TonB-linked outer membrane protein [Olivibacter sitiensis]|uniref:SusC/RagA family TonB-linked outer membrane protein n=1 Tax=Olivibacter sitiensis TaxID=376470 RepID=UPI0003FC44B0|nr:TonB-dependent receptor [Olivibacter sitiensis]